MANHHTVEGLHCAITATLAQPPSDGAGRSLPSGIQWPGRGWPSHRRGRRAGRRIQLRRAGPPQHERAGPIPEYDRQLITVTPAASHDTERGAAPETIGQPIPVHLSARAAEQPRHVGESGLRWEPSASDCEYDRCLLRPARISEWQTLQAQMRESAVARAPTAGGTGAFIKVELLNIQSLLPKLPDVRADVDQRHPDVVCFTETNLKAVGEI